MKRRYIHALLCLCIVSFAQGQQQAVITVNTNQPGAPVAPTLHGIFFEEISHGGEGGLYAELIQNRGFEESRLPPATSLQDGFLIPDRTPHFGMANNRASDWRMRWPVKNQWPSWSLQKGEGADISLALTEQMPLNQATPNSLQVTIGKLDPGGKNDLVNEGFWGINTVKGETYNLALYAHTDKYSGPLTVSLQSPQGKILASHTFRSVASAQWKKYNCQLVAQQSDAKGKFVISFGGTGTVWLDFVSLFPAKTFKNRPNGMRQDLAQYLADLKPSFVRWPGGCFVEGINVESSPNWKRSIGPVEKRSGTYSPWGYWSTDGFGYHEFLQFCEDINADGMYVFNAGVGCEMRSGTFIPDENVDSIISDVLDGLEYALGPANSKWGKVRAANGHPKPFPLKYIEIGNEQSGPRYARRYNWFYDAIKKKYPRLKIMASMGIGDVNKRTLDSMQRIEYADEHAYKAAYWSMRNYNHFDQYKRGNWDMYVGEYATNAGVGRGNMLAALSDAVYIMAMERNGDLVKMSSYAPLLVNVNDVDWPVNLINFDAAKSFGRISYYTIKMFNDHRADQNFATETKVIPSARKQARFSGGVGLATWDTESEYKDLQIIQDGKVVYTSDFINRLDEWKPVRGTWLVKDSAFAQTAMGAQRFSWLKGKSFDTYTLKLKARKTSKATNAFIIPFAVKDDNTMLRAHIGSYVNANAVFEAVTAGMNVSDLTNQKRLPAPVETGKWYDIKLEVGLDKVDCYMDDKLLISYAEPQLFFSIAGKDNKNGDIIVKVVNAASEPYKASLQINGTPVGTSAQAISISAESNEAENSLEEPRKYIPQTTSVAQAGNHFDMDFKPYSITILRLKDKNAKLKK